MLYAACFLKLCIILCRFVAFVICSLTHKLSLIPQHVLIFLVLRIVKEHFADKLMSATLYIKISVQQIPTEITIQTYWWQYKF